MLDRTAKATLMDIGYGTIYDTDLKLTWLKDANYTCTSSYAWGGRMFWSDAVAWAYNLVYAGFSDWRLPTTLQSDTGCSEVYNCTGSEVGHLFYNELGGTAGSNMLTSGAPDIGLFTNLQDTDPNWSGTATYNTYEVVYLFDFGTGLLAGIVV